jgi:hypothetical protein
MHTPNADYWQQLLLEKTLTLREIRGLPRLVQSAAREFLDEAPLVASAAETSAANSWYESADGQTTLSAIARDAWNAMAERAAHAMPAHDARHAMYKVPASAIQHMHSEAVFGYERVGVLGALLHDYGRWAEERIFGGPGEGAIHARFSFLLTQALLAGYEMPRLIRYHLLLAPLRHTTGAEQADPMPLKLTVSADRDQLYGPEIVIRLAHHGVDETWNQASFYGEKGGTPILGRLKHFHDNRLPGPLFVQTRQTLELQQILRTFLLISEDAESSRIRWADVNVRTSEKAAPRTFFSVDWQDAWATAQDRASSTCVSPDSRTALARLLTAPNLAPNPQHLADALAKVSEVPDKLDPYLARALDWVHTERQRLDLQETKNLQEILKGNPNDQLITTIGVLVLGHAC